MRPSKTQNENDIALSDSVQNDHCVCLGREFRSLTSFVLVPQSSLYSITSGRYVVFTDEMDML